MVPGETGAVPGGAPGVIVAGGGGGGGGTKILSVIAVILNYTKGES